VLIAEVTLSDNEEFGVELGLQDGLLFDRSAAVTNTTTGNSLNPGFPFVGQALGNASSVLTDKPWNPPLTGSQGTSNFSLNRNNPTLGYGGFVFSASSESVSVLIRALKVNQRLEVLSRPQVTTLDNQQAYVFVGQNVPYIANVNTTTYGQNNSIQWINAGLGLLVTPRISPDNVVSMQIDAQKSEVGPRSEGVPITAVNGEVITQPPINIAQAQTTVSAADGQTVVLGGLITKSKTDFHRKVPWLGDVPVLGRLFRYDGVENVRKELLIIMTPRVVRDKAAAEYIKQAEAARMNWCLSDVIELTDVTSLRPRSGDWSNAETEVIYPDLNPRAEKPTVDENKLPNGEIIPTPMMDIPPDPSVSPNGKIPAPSESPRIPNPDSGATAPSQRVVPPVITADPNGSKTVVPIVYDAPPKNHTTPKVIYR
jgi:general secretion pathway protein D